jgi:hypothetical protein
LGKLKNDFENDFQFQIKGYSLLAEGVNARTSRSDVIRITRSESHIERLSAIPAVSIERGRATSLAA